MQSEIGQPCAEDEKGQPPSETCAEDEKEQVEGAAGRATICCGEGAGPPERAYVAEVLLAHRGALEGERGRLARERRAEDLRGHAEARRRGGGAE